MIDFIANNPFISTILYLFVGVVFYISIILYEKIHGVDVQFSFWGIVVTLFWPLVFIIFIIIGINDRRWFR